MRWRAGGIMCDAGSGGGVGLKVFFVGRVLWFLWFLSMVGLGFVVWWVFVAAVLLEGIMTAERI